MTIEEIGAAEFGSRKPIPYRGQLPRSIIRMGPVGRQLPRSIIRMGVVARPSFRSPVSMLSFSRPQRVYQPLAPPIDMKTAPVHSFGMTVLRGIDEIGAMEF
jgi:hypothetical protein